MQNDNYITPEQKKEEYKPVLDAFLRCLQSADLWCYEEKYDKETIEDFLNSYIAEKYKVIEREK